jgi:hypothetical protein
MPDTEARFVGKEVGALATEGDTLLLAHLRRNSKSMVTANEFMTLSDLSLLVKDEDMRG